VRVLPVCLVEPLWVQFAALLPEHPVAAPSHPLDCRRPGVPDRAIFEHVIGSLAIPLGHPPHDPPPQMTPIAARS
jgi:hypothetical protein